jgi:hypothetical protein
LNSELRINFDSLGARQRLRAFFLVLPAERLFAVVRPEEAGAAEPPERALCLTRSDFCTRFGRRFLTLGDVPEDFLFFGSPTGSSLPATCVIAARLPAAYPKVRATALNKDSCGFGFLVMLLRSLAANSEGGIPRRKFYGQKEVPATGPGLLGSVRR